MIPFLGRNFLLDTQTAAVLYHETAAQQPIFDFHCHLSAQEIYEDRPCCDLYELWLAHDHYKWRTMRFAGVEERLITGDGDAYEKFLAWTSVVPDAIGSPLYHWVHLELRRYFGIEETLSPKTAPSIWKQANRIIRERRFSPRKLLELQNVRELCTTDDISEGLEAHRLLQADTSLKFKVYPTFRLDPLLELEHPGFKQYVQKLSEWAGFSLNSLEALQEALLRQMDSYDRMGCRTADHGLITVPYRQADALEAGRIYRERLEHGPLTREEHDTFRSYLLQFLFREYHKRNWVAQVHIGSLKNYRTRIRESFGSAAGCDSMHDRLVAEELNLFLDALDRDEALPRTILFNINPSMNDALASAAANFADEGIAGKVQLGTAWWLLDHKEGIERQLRCFAEQGLLAASVGMLTDSRSYLSYVRHEYYRRILCGMLGRWVESGEYPADLPHLQRVVKRICYENAKEFFRV